MLFVNKIRSNHLAINHGRIIFGVSINEGGRGPVFCFHIFRNDMKKMWASIYIRLFGRQYIKHCG